MQKNFVINEIQSQNEIQFAKTSNQFVNSEYENEFVNYS